MKLSIIIPAYNEEKTIAKVLGRVIALKIPNTVTEIIVVNDGSTDNTAKEIEKIAKTNKELIFVQHKKNQGKGAAIHTAIQAASGEYIIIQDADLEYDPKAIPSLFAPIQANKAKVVYGTRLKRLPNLKKEESHHLFLLHYFGNRFLSLITSILYGQWLTDMETCYKLFPTDVVKSFTLRAKSFDFEPEITAKLLKAGLKIYEVPITTVPRGYEEGKKLNTLRDGRIALWTLLKYRFTN